MEKENEKRQLNTPEERMEQTESPCRFVCGKTPVELCFKPDGKPLERLLESYFVGLKNG
jgi:hypothetical protein